MHAVALLWVLTIVPVKGDIQTLPFGYPTKDLCERSATHLISLIRRASGKTPRHVCAEVTQTEELHLRKEPK